MSEEMDLVLGGGTIACPKCTYDAVPKIEYVWLHQVESRRGVLRKEREFLTVWCQRCGYEIASWPCADGDEKGWLE